MGGDGPQLGLSGHGYVTVVAAAILVLPIVTVV